jgi:RNA polymerase sigma-70 factor, ECF subfamily
VEGRRRGAVLILFEQPGERRLDPEAAGEHIDTLFRVARAMSGSSDVAEDLVQETYVKVLSRPRLLRRDDDLGYLIKALKNTWYSHLRRERTRRAATDSSEHAPDELPARTSVGDPQSSLETGEVLDALADLPPANREAVAAVDIAGLSYAEAARALGVRQGTIMSRVYRGREQVAQAVGAG